MKLKCTYGRRHERSSLRESLETSQKLDYTEFKKIIKNYEFYAFDNRVNQILFIRKDFENNYKDYFWAYIQVTEECLEV